MIFVYSWTFEVIIIPETLDRLEMTEKVDANKTSCEFLLPLKPGERYEVGLDL